MALPERVPSLSNFSWQQPVLAISNTPPENPTQGDRYIVGLSPTGDFVGYAKYIAIFDGTDWGFDAAVEGMVCYVIAEAKRYEFDGTYWVEWAGGQDSINHAELTNLDFDNSGHIGFQKKLIYDSQLKVYIIKED